FLLDGPGLVEVKRRIEVGDEQFRPALAKLRADADKALELAPPSVMDKAARPPSGDKHDYMSRGSYWWPNPNSADGLPYIRRDGHYNPENDQFDARPRSRMCSAVDDLAVAYFFTGEERYAEKAAMLLRVWFLDPATKMNPHLKYGQGIPGICDGRALGIIDTVSFARLVDSVGLLGGCRAWRAQDQRALQEW